MGSGFKWIRLPPQVAVPGFDDHFVPLAAPEARGGQGNLAVGGVENVLRDREAARSPPHAAKEFHAALDRHPEVRRALEQRGLYKKGLKAELQERLKECGLVGRGGDGDK